MAEYIFRKDGGVNISQDRLHGLENAHNVKEKIMIEDKHQKLAEEIKGLFAKEFGQFRLEDFKKVLEVIRAESFGAMPDYYEAYEKASQEERDQIDFMMKL